MNQVEGDFRVTGNMLLGGDLKPPLGREKLLQEENTVVPQRLTDLVVWDSGQPLPATPASTTLGLVAGTFGTGNLYLSAGDLKAAGATTRRARMTVTLPSNYVAGQTVTLRFSAGMKTTVSDTSCTVDVEAYKVGRDTLVSGVDLVSTAATTINSLTFADKSFTVDPSGLSPGDQLDIRISIACNDGATATAVIPAIGSLELLVDTKG